MTVSEAVSYVDRMKPNHYEEEIKIRWLSKLDGMIYREVFQTHAGNPVQSFDGYSSADTSVELLVPYPYDEDIYNYFLQAQIDKENGEIGKYNQSITLFNSAYQNFTDWYHRTHAPIAGKRRFRF